jgi:uncharacterized protein YecT (DUF1311 family)
VKTIIFGAALALLSVTAAQAIDCAKAADDLEKTICGDSNLLKADDAMNRAYANALKAVGPKLAKLLKADQADWDTYRYDDCNLGDSEEDPVAPADLVKCLVEDTNKRTRFLTGAPLEGPGLSDALVPQVKTGVDDIYDDYLRFAAPKTDAEKAFNAWLDKQLKTLKFAKTEDQTSDWFQMELSYLSPTLLSANIDLTQNDGFAHPMQSNFAINLDMTTGRVLTMADLLDANALAKVQDPCVVQMKDYIAKGEEGDDIRARNIEQTVANLDHWTFGTSQATIRYIEYGMDSALTCTLTYDVLKPMVKATFPLPA